MIYSLKTLHNHPDSTALHPQSSHASQPQQPLSSQPQEQRSWAEDAKTGRASLEHFPGEDGSIKTCPVSQRRNLFGSKRPQGSVAFRKRPRGVG